MFKYNNSSLALKYYEDTCPAANAGIQSVYCSGVVDEILGFRQCAELVKISQETGATIHIMTNGKNAVANSILNLLMLQTVKGNCVVLSIQGGDLKAAFKRARKVLKFRKA